MNEQKPSMGRIVHVDLGRGIVRPAIVNRVNDDGTLGLSVFCAHGDCAMTDPPVMLLACCGDTPNTTPRWFWPPRV